jgi:hypothetical protein
MILLFLEYDSTAPLGLQRYASERETNHLIDRAYNFYHADACNVINPSGSSRLVVDIIVYEFWKLRKACS